MDAARRKTLPPGTSLMTCSRSENVVYQRRGKGQLTVHNLNQRQMRWALPKQSLDFPGSPASAHPEGPIRLHCRSQPLLGLLQTSGRTISDSHFQGQALPEPVSPSASPTVSQKPALSITSSLGSPSVMKMTKLSRQTRSIGSASDL